MQECRPIEWRYLYVGRWPQQSTIDCFLSSDQRASVSIQSRNTDTFKITPIVRWIRVFLEITD